MEVNSDHANVSWKHNFSVDSSVFVIEYTPENKSQTHLPRAGKGDNIDFTAPAGDPNHSLLLRFFGPSFVSQTLQGAVYLNGRYRKCYFQLVYVYDISLL